MDTKNLANFLLYNNLVPVAFGILFLGSAGALAATPAVQDAVLRADSVVTSVDNSYLLSADIEQFPFSVEVTNVTEDDEKYYVSYILSTIDLEDSVWRNLQKQRVLEISKEALGERDLGLYVTGELNQLRNSEKARLLETQAIERSVGETPKVVATVYSGLVGRMLSPTSEVFEGYIPVVAEVIEPPQGAVLGSTTSASGGADTIPPAVTVVGDTIMKVYLGAEFSDPGILVVGEETYSVVYILDSVEVSTFNNLDTSRVWAYVLTYRVSDSAGNTTEVRREVVVDGEVSAPPPPVIQEDSTVDPLPEVDVQETPAL